MIYDRYAEIICFYSEIEVACTFVELMLEHVESAEALVGASLEFDELVGSARLCAIGDHVIGHHRSVSAALCCCCCWRLAASLRGRLGRICWTLACNARLRLRIDARSGDTRFGLTAAALLFLFVEAELTHPLLGLELALDQKRVHGKAPLVDHLEAESRLVVAAAASRTIGATDRAHCGRHASLENNRCRIVHQVDHVELIHKCVRVEFELLLLLLMML